MPIKRQAVQRPTSQPDAAGDGGIGSAPVGSSHLFQHRKEVVIHAHTVEVHRVAIPKETHTDGLPGVCREVEEMPPHDGGVSASTQRVGIVGSVETGRGADAYCGSFAALHPQPQVFITDSGYAYGRRKHILAVARAVHQLSVSCVHSLLVHNRHTATITLVLPAADCPACVVGRRVDAVKVLVPRECGHCLAVVNAHHCRAYQRVV